MDLAGASFKPSVPDHGKPQNGAAYSVPFPLPLRNGRSVVATPSPVSIFRRSRPKDRIGGHPDSLNLGGRTVCRGCRSHRMGCWIEGAHHCQHSFIQGFGNGSLANRGGQSVRNGLAAPMCARYISIAAHSIRGAHPPRQARTLPRDGPVCVSGPKCDGRSSLKRRTPPTEAGGACS